MLKLARQTDGVFVTFAPPELTARARAAVGPQRRVCVIQAFTLHTDPAKARAIGARIYRLLFAPAQLSQPPDVDGLWRG